MRDESGLNGWHPDPLSRFEERYFIEGEPTLLVRTGGVEQQDHEPLSAVTRVGPVVGHPAPEPETAPITMSTPVLVDLGRPPTRRSAGRTPSTSLVAVLVAGVVAIVAIVAGAFVLSNRNGTKAHSTSAPVVTTASTRPATPSTTAPATFAQLFAADSSGVVRVDSTGCSSADVGSGFLVAPNLVATAAHVVEGSAYVTLHRGGSTSVGEVVGIDTISDVALVRAQTTLTGHIFTLARQTPVVGTAVATIGFPEALPITLTQGTVSAVGRSGQFEDGITRTGLIQTDTPVNPGNSGGPLLTTDGTVVGMVEGLRTGANGIGYATGIDVARPLLQGWEQAPHPVTLASCGSSGGGPAVQASLGLVQEWATALASQDWVTVRQIDPALAQTSDQALASGYGGLKEATIAYVSGDSQNLDVASIAYEDVGTGPRTNVYCYQVAIDPTVTTLTVLSERQATQPITGWVDPASLSATIASC